MNRYQDTLAWENELTVQAERLHNFAVLEEALDQEIDRLEQEHERDNRRCVYLQALDCDPAHLESLQVRMQALQGQIQVYRSLLYDTFREKVEYMEMIENQDSENSPQIANYHHQYNHLQHQQQQHHQDLQDYSQGNSTLEHQSPHICTPRPYVRTIYLISKQMGIITLCEATNKRTHHFLRKRASIRSQHKNRVTVFSKLYKSSVKRSLLNLKTKSSRLQWSMLDIIPYTEPPSQSCKSSCKSLSPIASMKLIKKPQILVNESEAEPAMPDSSLSSKGITTFEQRKSRSCTGSGTLPLVQHPKSMEYMEPQSCTESSPCTFQASENSGIMRQMKQRSCRRSRSLQSFRNALKLEQLKQRNSTGRYKLKSSNIRKKLVQLARRHHRRGFTTIYSSQSTKKSVQIESRRNCTGPRTLKLSQNANRLKHLKPSHHMGNTDGLKLIPNQRLTNGNLSKRRRLIHRVENHSQTADTTFCLTRDQPTVDRNTLVQASRSGVWRRPAQPIDLGVDNNNARSILLCSNSLVDELFEDAGRMS